MGRLAKVYPLLDITPEARERALAEAFEDEEPTCYAREARDAWIEGRRAHVRVLGVQYRPASHGEPERVQTAAWSFELRRRGDEWQIFRYVEGDVDEFV